MNDFQNLPIFSVTHHYNCVVEFQSQGIYFPTDCLIIAYDDDGVNELFS